MTTIDNQSALDACILGLECDPNHLYLLYVFFFLFVIEFVDICKPIFNIYFMEPSKPSLILYPFYYKQREECSFILVQCASKAVEQICESLPFGFDSCFLWFILQSNGL